MTEKIMYLQEKIEQAVGEILNQATNEESVDYFKIEITNHNGKLQFDYKFREIVKVY